MPYYIRRAGCVSGPYGATAVLALLREERMGLELEFSCDRRCWRRGTEMYGLHKPTKHRGILRSRPLRWESSI